LVRAEKAAQRAAGLAKQLLAFSKGGEPIKRLISVRQSVEDAVSLVLSGSSVEAVIDLPTDLHAVNADEGQLSQAFHNIIINAVQAMPDGGRLTVSARNVAITGENSPGLAAGDYVEILFADEGCGIAAEDLERIFDPYFTSKADGSGLGLASTYTVIKKHSGHISVSSAPGKGTIFTILLPGCGEPVSEDPQEAQTPGAAHGVYSILVMDDDEMVRELADITLKRFGYEVVCCDNGAAAVSLYRTTREEGVPFSLVIMDLTIPGGMGGIEAARQILAFDPEAKLIVSSGYSDDPVMASFADYGFCAALEKPYNVEEIVRILQRTQREAPT
jgi:CheY-like chemotaxis protein/anti-sigma regulatory factor (Ser/Thr protein kinase)